MSFTTSAPPENIYQIQLTANNNVRDSVDDMANADRPTFYQRPSRLNNGLTIPIIILPSSNQFVYQPDP